MSHEAGEMLAQVARMLARAGLLEGFGHASARLQDGRLLITPTMPLGAVTASDLHVVALDAVPSAGSVAGLPLETALHAAIYAARPDVGAICRTHSPWAVVFGARGAVPPLAHGLGGLAGSVALYQDFRLVTDAALGRAAAEALGHATCLLLRGNGALATGPDPQTALVRAYFLEERARVAHAAGPEAALPAGDLMEERARHFAAEARRAWQWLAWRFGEDGEEHSSR